MAAVVGVANTKVCLSLDDPAAGDPALCGAKAASLAVARSAGLPVMPGVVVTATVHEQYLSAGHVMPEEVAALLRPAWESVSAHGSVSLVVRSSSTIEDVAASSMAGQFRSVLNVQGWDEFLDAVGRVFASADEICTGTEPNPMAVLVQPFLVPERGGVLFGVDPVTGDSRRIVVEAVAGGPDALVSGRVTAQHYEATARGRVIAIDHRPWRRRVVRGYNGRLLPNGDMRALARLAAEAQGVFGSPQDIEWAFHPDGSLLLLQSRPVTATGRAAYAQGPVLGPGPVAETFPDPLCPLEADMWVVPLRRAVVAAMNETRAVARHRLDSSPVVTTVHGRVAVDLELFGYEQPRRIATLLDPRPSLRRLAASWHVGMLRAVLPGRAEQLVHEVDSRLSEITLDDRTDLQLLDLLDDCAAMLERLQHDEILAATLLPPATRTAAAIALEMLAHHGEDLGSDDILIRRYPVLLSLIPPALGMSPRLPPAAVQADRSAKSDQCLGPREALRLRARWVQELSARAAWLLGCRLATRGVIDDPSSVAFLDMESLRDLVTDGQVGDISDRQSEDVSAAFSPPLPTQFRLTQNGDVVAAARPGARPGAGVGAGGGRGTGPAAHGTIHNPPAPGDVLVVRDLQPGLAAWLPGLAGLVAETGGTLSHLAILAREFGVPTVVGVHGALLRFPPGVPLLVDGFTGEVVRLDMERSP